MLQRTEAVLESRKRTEDKKDAPATCNCNEAGPAQCAVFSVQQQTKAWGTQSGGEGLVRAAGCRVQSPHHSNLPLVGSDARRNL